MVVDAAQLLRERETVHPSRIVASVLEDNRFQLWIAGHPWWRDKPSDGEEEIRFEFSGITSGTLNLIELLDQSEDEALLGFEIASAATLDWAQPVRSDIYCSAPLPHPLAVYAAVEDHLFALDAFVKQSDFLNGGARLSQFLRITASPTYLLATCPDSICKLIREELERQSVSYSILPAGRILQGRLIVRLGGTGFCCESALAEFD